MSRARQSRKVLGVVGATVALVLTAACGPKPAPPAPAPAVAAQGGGCQPNATTSAIFNATNGARQTAHVGAVQWNGQLGCLAQEWSDHMGAVNAMTHRDLNATLHLPAFAAFHTLAENVLTGPQSMSVQQMHAAWMGSAGHYANIANPAFTLMGIGVSYANGKVWATENFGA